MAVDEQVHLLARGNDVELFYGQLVDMDGYDFQVPHITIQQIRSAITPHAHCWEKSDLCGLADVARDVLPPVLFDVKEAE